MLSYAGFLFDLCFLRFIMYNMQFFNAHCHNFVPTPHVTGAIVNATQESEWGGVLTQQSNAAHIALGVHPWNIDSVTDGWTARLMQILVENLSVMVGECGLDGLRPDMDTQIGIFISQLKIAAELKRTIHIHCVRAWNEMMRLIKSENLPPVIVMHAFSGAPAIMTQMPENVFYSFSPAILDVNHKRVRESVVVCPENRILIESDDMPASVLPDVAATVAELRGTNVERMAEILFNNAQRIITNG